MHGFIILLHTRLNALAHQMDYLISSAKLKTIVVSLGAIFFWVSMFQIFKMGFDFLGDFPGLADWLAEYLFALFFFALTLMLIISNAIISYSTLYRAKESAFLISSSLKPANIFLYKLTESLVFSSWAFIFLGTPLMVAYGFVRGVPVWFYFLTLAFFGIYIFIPAGLGALVSMFLATFFPRKKKQIIIALSLISLLIIVIIISNLAALHGIATPLTAQWMRDILGKLSFCQNPILPSYWIVQGIISSARLDLSNTLFFFLLILANSMFLVLVAYKFAKWWYLSGYSTVQSGRRSRKYPARTWIDYIASAVFAFLKPPLRLIIIKDIKTFLRDAVQYSQFLIFFGLLGVYFINLRNVPYLDIQSRFWQYLVSFLNLTATTLTLATFTTRFVYPQLSLEGQRFWIIGMLPIKRKSILYAKFIFALCGALLVSETLIFTSSWMLHLPWKLTLLQLYVVAIICLGLSALSVGIGAIYPDLREDNPSKIVSGFGGTLNLILSLLFVLAVIVIVATPCHLYYVSNRLDPVTFRQWLAVSTVLITILGVGVTIISLSFGLSSLRRLEV